MDKLIECSHAERTGAISRNSRKIEVWAEREVLTCCEERCDGVEPGRALLAELAEEERPAGGAFLRIAGANDGQGGFDQPLGETGLGDLR